MVSRAFLFEKEDLSLQRPFVEVYSLYEGIAAYRRTMGKRKGDIGGNPPAKTDADEDDSGDEVGYDS